MFEPFFNGSLLAYKLGDFQEAYELATKALALCEGHHDSVELLKQLRQTTCFQGAPTVQTATIGQVFNRSAVDEVAPYGARHISLSDVKLRMKSVGNIQKITKAMKMVAASRLKGALVKCEQSRGLVAPMYRMLGDEPGVDVEKTTVVPVSSDRGLCGGINNTVVKYSKVLAALEETTPGFSIVGEKARSQMTKLFAEDIGSTIVDYTKVPVTFATASMVSDAILAQGSGKNHVIYNKFQSVISYRPTIATILSSEELEKAAENGLNKFDEYEMEGPDRGEFLLDLAEFQMGAVMYNAMLENSTSELGSRMQAMESSTKNASDMLNRLTLLYNRTRQAAITTELIEIISGASALEG